MNATDLALYTALSAGTALTSLLSGGTASPSIYQWLAPENQDPPYVVYHQQASTPRYTAGGVAFEDQLYLVKGVTLGHSATAAGTIATQIDALLTDKALTISGYTHLYLRRVSDVDYPEIAAGGQRYQHRGAVFRVLADPS